MKKTITITTIAMAALALTGCSGSGSSNGGSSKTTDVYAACKPGVDLYAHPECVNNPAIEGADPTEDPMPAEEDDYPAEGEGPAEGDGIEKVKPGKGWVLTSEYSEEEGDATPEITVKVVEAKCDQPMKEMGDDIEYVPVQPEAGKKFCYVSTWAVNTGKVPFDDTPGADGIVTEDGKTFRSNFEIDGPVPAKYADSDTNVTDFGLGFSETLNPGEGATVLYTVQVPKAAKPAELSFESTSLVTFELPKK